MESFESLEPGEDISHNPVYDIVRLRIQVEHVLFYLACAE